MAKIFIDCGAWKGISSIFFRENHPQGKEFKYLLFECNPEIYDDLYHNVKDFGHIFQEAVWIKNGTMNLYTGKGKYTESSSILLEKRTGKLDKENPIKIKTINFGKFLLDNIHPEDEVFCKMNIEGAEYDVIDHLTLDYAYHQSPINLIDKLYVQWHYKKINTISEKRHNYILNRLKKFDIELYNWPLDHDENLNIDPKFYEYFKKSLT